ncbi:unnamed protein product [Protopolystoma xenopodis]|uniref:Mediator of RNA polymerase II transcription subunit 10 n=1 Tax=Protopolystoma xenopodis TaxID=117903 RepID=A0A448X885_9PLAT|nr:unnamed protein product [Protopolystoma xenopodis]
MGDRNRFELLEEAIESIINHAREAGIIVCDYQPSITFQRRINELVIRLQDVNKLQNDFHDVFVPIEVFTKIDAGQNPQLYTRECMERALARNEAVRGKLESLRRFRALLMSELSSYFPNEIAKYRSVRGDPDAFAPIPSSVGSLSHGNTNVFGTSQQHAALHSQTNGSTSDAGDDIFQNRLPP